MRSSAADSVTPRIPSPVAGVQAMPRPSSCITLTEQVDQPRRATSALEGKSAPVTEGSPTTLPGRSGGPLPGKMSDTPQDVRLAPLPAIGTRARSGHSQIADEGPLPTHCGRWEGLTPDGGVSLHLAPGQRAGRLAVILAAEASLQVGHDGPDVSVGVLGPEIVDGLAQFRFRHLLWAI